MVEYRFLFFIFWGLVFCQWLIINFFFKSIIHTLFLGRNLGTKQITMEKLIHANDHNFNHEQIANLCLAELLISPIYLDF